MKFKSKRHLVLSLKKKSGVELSDAEIKELLGIEGAPETKEEPKKEEPKKEEEPKKDEEVKKEADPNAAAPAMSMEDLGAAIASLQENMNMLMEALATIMEGQSAAPAEEAKVDDAEKDPKKEEEVKDEEKADAPAEEDEEEEQTEDEMEKELEKTIAELESLN